MTQLFEARPGTVFKLEGVKPDDLFVEANQFLQEGEFFHCFGVHKTDAELGYRAQQLISHLGGISLPMERPLTVSSGGDIQPVLGLELVKGKLLPPGAGTTYQRPVARNAKKPDHEALAGKNFLHVPLGGPLVISAPGEREFTVEPGYGYLAAEDETYSVNVPEGQISVDLVLDREGENGPSTWNRYIGAQPGSF